MSNETHKHEKKQENQQTTTPTTEQPSLDTATQDLTDADLEVITGGVGQLVQEIQPCI